MNDDILYKPEEIAEKLKITKGTVYEMIKRGDLEAHRIGRHIRVSGTQLDYYLLKARGSENIYEAELIHKNGETLATVGSVNISVSTDLEGRAKVSIRPEDIILSKGTFVSSARNVFKGTVKNIIEEGSSAKVILDIGMPMTALITKKSLNEMGIVMGTELYAIFKTMAVKVYK
ncbi:MAG: binding protein [Firmicutes bacterium]|nr:binding protein [Bacillota bacterium]